MTARAAAWHGVIAALAGGVFGVGLVISGMTQPPKVIAFLDILSGRWDPSLALVMAGAIGVHALAYRLVRKRGAPLLAPTFAVPGRRDIDLKLVAGGALFGVGWGLGGYCPGPALVSVASFGGGIALFVLSLIAGMLLADLSAVFRVRILGR
jgi:uncharacterized protein